MQLNLKAVTPFLQVIRENIERHFCFRPCDQDSNFKFLFQIQAVKFYRVHREHFELFFRPLNEDTGAKKRDSRRKCTPIIPILERRNVETFCQDYYPPLIASRLRNRKRVGLQTRLNKLYIVSLLSRRANARDVSQHTLYGVQHIHINLALIHCTL